MPLSLTVWSVRKLSSFIKFLSVITLFESISLQTIGLISAYIPNELISGLRLRFNTFHLKSILILRFQIPIDKFFLVWNSRANGIIKDSYLEFLTVLKMII